MADSKNRSRQISKVPLITPNQNVDSLNNLPDNREYNEQAIKAVNDAEYASSPNKMETINETEEDGPSTGQKDHQPEKTVEVQQDDDQDEEEVEEELEEDSIESVMLFIE